MITISFITLRGNNLTESLNIIKYNQRNLKICYYEVLSETEDEIQIIVEQNDYPNNILQLFNKDIIVKYLTIVNKTKKYRTNDDTVQGYILYNKNRKKEYPIVLNETHCNDESLRDGEEYTVYSKEI